MPNVSPSTSQRDSDGRWMRASRLAMAAFATFGVISLAWMLPWAPSGLSPRDYSPELLFTAFLLAGVAISGIVAFAFRDIARRDRDRVAALGEFYDDVTGMQNRFFLLERLAARAEQAANNARSFMLMIFRFDAVDEVTSRPITVHRALLNEIGEAIKRRVGRGDLVATLGHTEFAIVADKIRPEQAVELAADIKTALVIGISRTFDKKATVSIASGAAAFPRDAEQPDALVAFARADALRHDVAA